MSAGYSGTPLVIRLFASISKGTRTRRPCCQRRREATPRVWRLEVRRRLHTSTLSSPSAMSAEQAEEQTTAPLRLPGWI
jgi:hypothetical protein